MEGAEYIVEQSRMIRAQCEALGEDVFDGCALVYVRGAAGSSAEAYCLNHTNCVFVAAE